MRVSVVVLLHAFAACNDDSGDQPTATGRTQGHAGESSDSWPSGAGAGGTSEGADCAVASAPCDKLCAVFDVLTSASPCRSGDLVVRGVLVPREGGGGGEGGASDVAGSASDAPNEELASCLADCRSEYERGGAECEPLFVAMADCLAEVVWSCRENSSWVAHDCDVPVQRLAECLEQ